MSFFKPKMPKLPPVPQSPQRDLALEAIQAQDLSKSRKGRAANLYAGAEQTAAKTLTGQ